jgi:hypothetical protein
MVVANAFCLDASDSRLFAELFHDGREDAGCAQVALRGVLRRTAVPAGVRSCCFVHAAAAAHHSARGCWVRVLCQDIASARGDGQQPAHGVGGLMAIGPWAGGLVAIGAAPACIVHCDRRICDH